MSCDEVIRTLGNIYSWDVDRGPCGEEKRKAIDIAIKAVELCGQLFDLMMEVSDKDGEHRTERSE